MNTNYCGILIMLQLLVLLTIYTSGSLLLRDQGPAYGYFPESSKCVLVIDDRSKDKAQDLFFSLGVHVAAGHRFLEGFIGSKDEMLSNVSDKAQH